MRDFILREIQKRENEYKLNPVRAEQDYNRENEDKESYHGRELLELLQNADDEINDSEKSTVEIKLEKSVLTISNDGNPFSKEGIVSLMYSNVSSKRENNKVIGNKGTGFRSVLSWAKEIRIDSSDLHVRFTPEYSQKKLNQIMQNLKDNGDARAAVLAFPEWRETKNSSKYTTRISLHVKDEDAEKDIYNQMMSLDGETLLFLNNITELVVETDETINTIRKNVNDDGSITIDFYYNGELDENKSRVWRIEKLEGQFEDRSYSIVVAYDKTGREPNNQVLYSYFPTQIEFPFCFLLHADFDLDSNRNHLINNQANREVLNQAAALIVKSAKVFFQSVSYDRLKYIIPKYGLEGLSRELSNYGFKDALWMYIKNNDVFPTVDNNYIVLDSKTYVYYKGGFSKYLEGKAFPKILMYTDDFYIRNLIDRIYEGRSLYYKFPYMCKMLNSWAEKLSFNRRNINRLSRIVVALIHEYVDCLNQSIDSDYLTVFFNQSGELISNDNPIFVKGKDLEISKLPRFARIEFLCDDMVESLHDIIEGDFFETLNKVNIRNYSMREIIDSMNSKIRKQLKRNKKRAYEYSLQALEWLWNNKELISDKINLLIPLRDNTLIDSFDAYIGREYGNEVGERIVSIIDNDSFVADFSEVLNADVKEIAELLGCLGVNKYPKRKRIKVSDKNYIKEVLSELKYPYKEEGDIFQDVNAFMRVIKYQSVEVEEYTDFDTILKKADTADVLQWIKEDAYFNGAVRTQKEQNNSCVYVRWGNQRDERIIREIKKPVSYIFWKLHRTKWIQVEEDKYFIDDCLMSLPDSIDLKPLLVRPDVERYIEFMSGKKTKVLSEITSVLELVGVKRDFADLSAEKIYDVLLTLPAMDVPVTYVRQLYESLINDADAVLKRVSSCKNYKKFLKSGSVLCSSGEYKSLGETYYVCGKDICGNLLESFNIMELPKGRKNFTSVPKLFGVERIEIKGVKLVDFVLSEDNKEFQRDFADYKKLAFSFRIDSKQNENKEARRFDKISITLCTKVTISYNDNLYELDSYDFLLQGDSQYYFCVPEVIDIYNLEVGIGVSNIICSYLDVYGDESNLRELYCTRRENRLRLLYESVGKETVVRAINAMKGGFDVREEFIQILNDITDADLSEYTGLIDDIDFETLNSVVNYETIIDLFKKLSIDIDVYNANNPSIRIDLTDYYESIIKNEFPKYREAYRYTLYEKYVVLPLEEKKNFQSAIHEFNNIVVKPVNSVLFDVKTAIMDALEISSLEFEFSITDLYNDNYKKLMHMYPEIEKKMMDELKNKSQVDSLLYFGELEEIHRVYLDCYMNQDNSDVSQVPDDTYAVNPILVEFKTEKPSKTKASNRSKERKTTGFTPKVSSKKLEEEGFLGEQCVYRFLCDKSEGRPVNWVSENAKKTGVNPEGAAGAGYDMEYYNSKNEICYVEVKASTEGFEKGIRFYLSENEYNFARSNWERYYVYYVANVRSSTPEIKVLDNLFVENQFNESAYSVSVREYCVSAEVINPNNESKIDLTEPFAKE